MTTTIQKEPTAAAVGFTFVQLLRQELTAEQFTEMQQRNGSDAYGDCCASHDFCDANMVMVAAFEAHGLDPIDGFTSDAMLALWNAAWTAARPALTDITLSQRGR